MVAQQRFAANVFVQMKKQLMSKTLQKNYE